MYGVMTSLFAINYHRCNGKEIIKCLRNLLGMYIVLTLFMCYFSGMMLNGFFVAIRNRILIDASQKAAIWIGNHPLLFCHSSTLFFFSQETSLSS